MAPLFSVSDFGALEAQRKGKGREGDGRIGVPNIVGLGWVGLEWKFCMLQENHLRKIENKKPFQYDLDNWICVFQLMIDFGKEVEQAGHGSGRMNDDVAAEKKFFFFSRRGKENIHNLRCWFSSINYQNLRNI